jgi:hypothetical protein
MYMRQVERHRAIEPAGFGPVLGANDGIVSTASLVVGVAAADAPKGILVASWPAGGGRLVDGGRRMCR